MARGRKPKPAALAKLEGDTRKQAKQPRQVAARPTPDPAELPAPPNCLDADELQCWESLAGEMHAAGLLDALARPALVSYCRMQVLAARCWEQMTAQPVVSIDGKPTTNPYLTEARRAEALLVTLRKELGLPRADRPAPAAAEPDDPADAVLGFGGAA